MHKASSKMPCNSPPIPKRIVSHCGPGANGIRRPVSRWNDLERAEHTIRQGISLVKNWRTAASLSGYLSLALLFAERADFGQAYHHLSIAHDIAIEFTDSTLDDWMVEFNEQRIRLMGGDLTTVHAWLQQRGLLDLSPSQIEQMEYVTHMTRQYEGLIYARLLLEYKQPAMALAWIEPMMQEVERQGRISRMVECLVRKPALTNSLANGPDFHKNGKSAQVGGAGWFYPLVHR